MTKFNCRDHIAEYELCCECGERYCVGCSDAPLNKLFCNTLCQHLYQIAQVRKEEDAA